jgi:hypothetical protein
MTHLNGCLHKYCGGIVNPLCTQMQYCMVTLLLCFCYVIINFLPTRQAWVRHKKITPAKDGLHDKAVHIMFHTKQNTLSIVYNVPSWLFIRQLSYFKREYGTTVSTWPCVHVCAPRYTCARTRTRAHTHAHAHTYTHATVNDTPYFHISNLFMYLFNLLI